MIYDPRPDLEEDTDFWTALLNVACYEDNGTFEMFMGFRNAGCRLAMNREHRNLSFNFGTEANDDKVKEIKNEAQAQKDNIKSLFKRVYRGFEKMERRK